MRADTSQVSTPALTCSAASGLGRSDSWEVGLQRDEFPREPLHHLVVGRRPAKSIRMLRPSAHPNFFSSSRNAAMKA